jgi:hypothetical protein
MSAIYTYLDEPALARYVYLLLRALACKPERAELSACRFRFPAPTRDDSGASEPVPACHLELLTGFGCSLCVCVCVCEGWLGVPLG